MPEQNLNPDALDVLATVVFSCPLEDWNEHDEDEKRQLLAPYTRIIDTYLSALPAQSELQENSKPNQNLELSSKQEKLSQIAEKVTNAALKDIYWSDLVEMTDQDGLTEDEVSEVLGIIRSAKVVIPNE